MSLIRYQRDDVAVVEYPPTCHTIFIEKMGDGVRTFYLSFPWMVFVLFRYQVENPGMDGGGLTWSCRTHVGFRNSPLTDTDQMLYYPHLYNIYTDLRVCMPSTALDTVDPNLLYAGAIAKFWDSWFKFSMSLDQDYCAVRAYSTDPRVADFADWERNTYIDPGFVTTVEWKPCTQLSRVLEPHFWM